MQHFVVVTENKAAKMPLFESLANLGFRVIVCQEIEAAEALLTHLHVDILLTELSVQKQNGLDGLRLARYVSTYFPKVTILGIHDTLSSDIIDLTCAAGMSLVFPKDVDAQELIETARLFPDKDLRGPISIEHLEILDVFLKHANMQALLQPIIALDNSGESKLLGVESLVRPPAEHTLLAPEVLFTYAARKDRLFETDCICIEAALREACHLETILFINVRPRSFANPSFIDTVCLLAKKYNVPFSNIVFELTEQQTLLNITAFKSTFDHLRHLGFKMALDDFGVGFSNLQLIHELKPDYIKLAGVFCRHLEQDPYKQVIVQTAVHMASQLCIPTIIENVETSEEKDAAIKLGVQYAQGFLYCKPLKKADLLHLGWFKTALTKPSFAA